MKADKVVMTSTMVDQLNFYYTMTQLSLLGIHSLPMYVMLRFSSSFDAPVRRLEKESAFQEKNSLLFI